MLPPHVLSPVRIQVDKNSKKITGCLIACPMIAKTMLEKKALAEKKVLRAARLAVKVGAKIVGLGGFTSSVTDSGRTLSGKVNIAVTTGNSLTAAIAYLDIVTICRKLGTDYRAQRIAVVGATGSIGYGLTKMLIKHRVKSLVLIGKTPSHMVELRNELRWVTKANITFSTDIAAVKKADLVIMATASPGVVLSRPHLKIGAIVYDLTQPRNVAADITSGRNDLRLFSGGLVRTPGVWHKLATGLPAGVNFACLTETMLLALEGDTHDYTGRVQVENIERILRVLKKYHFTSALKASATAS